MNSMFYRLFEKMDHDSNNCISQHELKELIADIKFGKLPLDVEEAVLKLIEELDTDGDHLINEDEFVSGFAIWLDTTDNQDPSTTESQDDIYQVSEATVHFYTSFGFQKCKIMTTKKLQSFLK